MGDIIVIGVGNEFRGDDGVGILAKRTLEKRGFSGVVFVELSGEGTELMNLLETANSVLILDAVSSGSVPGHIHRLDASTTTIPSDFFNYSTHAFSVAEAIEMQRTLFGLPDSTVILGLEGHDFSNGRQLSEPVQEAFTRYVEMASKEITNLITVPHA